MLKRANLDAQIGHERWLVSYADLLTLLFAFFVVMYSVSQVNENKYRILSESFESVFSDISDLPADERSDDTERRLASLDVLEGQLHESLSGLINQGELTLTGNEDWVEIDIDSSILFESGQANLSSEAEKIFSEVADLLAPYENAVAVAGHTDSLPIRNAQYENNWQLSSARAVAVVHLLAYSGVNPEQLSAIGYGEFRPVADNSTDEGRARNRRVVLRVARDIAPQPRLDTQTILDTSGELSPEEDSPEEDSIELEELETIGSGATEPKEPKILPQKLKNGGLLFSTDLSRGESVERDSEELVR